jgi:hypothetical protein
MREVLRHKLVATSLCAGPHRIAWAQGQHERAPRTCLCGSPQRHYAQFVGGSEQRREHVA